MNKSIANSKTAVIGLLTGLIAGGVIMYAVSRQARLADRQELAQLKAKLNTFGRVVIAVKDVAEGEEITRDALEERKILETKIPDDAIISAELLVGRTAKYDLSAGEIVSQHAIAPSGNLYYYCRLAPGMRALSFQIDEAPRSALIEPDSLLD